LRGGSALTTELPGDKALPDPPELSKSADPGTVRVERSVGRVVVGYVFNAFALHAFKLSRENPELRADCLSMRFAPKTFELTFEGGNLRADERRPFVTGDHLTTSPVTWSKTIFLPLGRLIVDLAAERAFLDRLQTA
jgi:hypothetical protein